MGGYAAWVKEREADPAFARALETLRGARGRTVLLYSHDDPDGLTSALLLERLLAAQGAAKVITLLPPTFELEESRVAADAKQYHPDLVVISDKGTMGYYDHLLASVPRVLVIDHHFKQGVPEKAVCYNPGAWCCSAFLVHNLATALGVRDEGMDFLALIGLKGDWAVEPATGTVSPYIRAFYDEIAPAWERWLRPVAGECTWFDVNQRERTTLLSQSTELFCALCGNGFQYFYNDREPALKDVDQVALTKRALAAAAKDVARLRTLSTRGEVLEALAEAPTAARLWAWYQADWKRVAHLLDAVIPVVKCGGTQLFLFIGNNIPLLPMIGSVKLYELTKSKGTTGALMMGNALANGTTHFSLRGNSDEVHLGKICDQVVRRLLARYGQEHKDFITGGGHALAAELKIRREWIPFHRNLCDLLGYLGELEELAGRAASDPAARAQAFALGYGKEEKK